MNEMMLSTNVQGGALLVQVKEAVCNDHRKLKVFAEVLCKITATAEIGSAVMREYSKCRNFYHAYSCN